MKIDYPYLLMVVILLILFYLELKDQRNQKRCFNIAALLTWLFIGLRAKSVGADTLEYVNNFVRGNHVYHESLYNFFYLSLRKIWCNETFFLMLTSFLSLITLYYLVKKYASYKVFSVLLFFVLGYYFIYFVALRQILATSIFFVGVMTVLDNKKHKWWIYSICTITSCFAHNFMVIVSLLFTVVYFIPIQKKKTALILVASSGIIGVFFDATDVLRLFDAYFSLGYGITTERLNAYMTASGVNDSLAASVLGQLYYAIIGFFVIYFISDDKINLWIVKMYIVYIILISLFREIFMIDRIVLPFALMGCIVATWSLDNIRKAKDYIPQVLAIILFLYILNGYARQQIDYNEAELGRMHPYYFNWEDDSDHPSYYLQKYGTLENF